MKKIINIVLMFSLIIPMLFVPEVASAKTLRDLINELNQMETELKETKNQKKLTEKQISTIHATINSITKEVASAQVKIDELSNEIIVLNDNINSKDREIKDIINFIQVSNGENAYLEYAFGAKSFTDFIYRMAVSEQLAKYNQSLITEFNDMITKNNETVDALNRKTVELNQKQGQLSVEMKKLGSQLSDLIDVNVTIEEEIELQRDAIKLYQSLDCGLDEDIKVCGRNKLPPDTKFFRPTESGRVTSEFGMRFHPTKKTWKLHAGTDFGALAYGTNIPVYSAAKGMVIAVSRQTSCGGNVVYIHHNVNGKYYTTMYAHLQKILVNPKDVVTTTTQIGVMGGSPALTPWDKCTTGLHLHFQISEGLYLKDYQAYSTFTARSFDSRKIVNIPPGNKYFYDRLTKY
jgi:murein DD-endopeptidase MepM/ murein hydrolase activator NlpD